MRMGPLYSTLDVFPSVETNITVSMVAGSRLAAQPVAPPRMRKRKPSPLLEIMQAPPPP